MRPLGVTLAACYEFLRAFLIGVLSLGVLFVGGMASRLAGAEGHILQRVLGRLGEFVGVALPVYAGIRLIQGVGLLLRQNWTRLTTMLFTGLGFVLLLPRLMHTRPVSGFFALLNLAVLFYLAMPEARRYFETKESVTPNVLCGACF